MSELNFFRMVSRLECNTVLSITSGNKFTISKISVTKDGTVCIALTILSLQSCIILRGTVSNRFYSPEK